MADMKYRKLRIAWSVAWGIVCRLLIGLWVRSYHHCDSYLLIGEHQITSLHGKLIVDGVLRFSEKVMMRTRGVVGFVQHYRFSPPGITYLSGGLVIPVWLLLLATVGVASASWCVHWRFSLRTLLVVTTLVAVGLGVIVYAMR
jgi:hypothetical protein